ncbi:hypothetical protein EJB05_24689, partial [Eragrostis curvula]
MEARSLSCIVVETPQEIQLFYYGAGLYFVLHWFEALDGFSLFVLFVYCITSFALAESDVNKLYSLKDSFTKTKGFLQSWFDSEIPPCNWWGVTCEGRTVVAIDLSSVPLHSPFPSGIMAFQSLVGLYLSGCGISGEIPEALGNLQHLQYLDLKNNQLTGPIPGSLYNLKMLKEIVLDKNSLSGQLSPSIAQLQHLTKLSTYINSISGALPPELGSLQKLEYLNLGRNHFTGNIPSEICNLKWLKDLSLFECNLSGNIPRSIGRLKSLQVLNLSGNKFNAELPASVGELRSLTHLSLNNARLRGSIPKELGNCKKLVQINLSYNAFISSIPEELAGLEDVVNFQGEMNKLSGHVPDWIKNWESVDLGYNKLSGSIPPTICQANSLRSLILRNNNLIGNISETFIGCKNLTNLNLQGNNLCGEIPKYLAELPLVHLDLSHNNFTGVLPSKLWESLTILEISLNNNQLTGLIPESISKLHSLQLLDMGHNCLEGPIPPSVGGLRNLNILVLDRNRLSGNIPQELFNCRNLVTLNLSSNKLTGHIPRAISQLTLLTSLVLSHNQLSGSIPAEICWGFTNEAHSDKEYLQHHGFLDLSYNQLSGPIPASIKNCSILVQLHLQGNSLNGSIPAEFSDLANLTTVDLSFNSLVGPMLPWSVPLPLQGLYLSNNHLSGNIPAEIGNILPNIMTLDLSGNAFMATLPQSLLCSKSLSHLDVSNNNLSGQIPLPCPGDKELSRSLAFFNASFNHFSGSLDESISNFSQLSFLDIRNNSLTGSLPSSLSNDSYLNYLDLSNNDFSGTFPSGICNISSITFANFSGNHIGMNNLSDCVAPCICTANSINHNRVHPPHVILRAATICAIALTIVISLVLLVVYVRRKLLRSTSQVLVRSSEAKATREPTSSDELLGQKSWEPPSINLATFESVLLRVTKDDILKATDNFSEVHIIGSGGFGTVYRAALPEGQRVAIKRLHGYRQFQGDREFLAEIETIGKVKHRNLVPLLGYCAHDNQRVLIYEYMHHGSLEMWLRNRADAAEALGWPARLKICLGSARGLRFLHHGFVPHIIHRDMKSSNILLDENMEPRVSDFGLARIISAYETHVSTNVAGTPGYIPPEYGLAMKCTAKGDVYSFGVVILEVLTGRPPTEQKDMEEGDGNLVSWVRWMTAHGRQGELFDPCLPVSGLWRKQMSCVLSIAEECTADEPCKRPTMAEVVKGLKMIQLMEHEPHNAHGHQA